MVVKGQKMIYYLAFLLHHIKKHGEGGQNCHVRANVICITPLAKTFLGPIQKKGEFMEIAIETVTSKTTFYNDQPRYNIN